MRQWFSDNMWLLIVIVVVVVLIAAYLAYRERRARAATARAKRLGTASPATPPTAEIPLDIRSVEVAGRSTTTVRLTSDKDAQALGALMPRISVGDDLKVITTGFIEVYCIRRVSADVWALKSELDVKWTALRAADLLLTLRRNFGPVR